MLHDGPQTGRVLLGDAFDGPDVRISRADVAEVLAATLKEPHTIGQTFEVIEGDIPINEALKRIVPH